MARPVKPLLPPVQHLRPHPRDRSTNDRRQQERPHLPQRIRPCEHRGGDRSRRVHRRVAHGDADQVDEGQREADGERRDGLVFALGGDGEDDGDEHGGQDDLGQEDRAESEAAGGGGAVAVGGEAGVAGGGEVAGGAVGGDEEDDCGSDESAEDLADDVAGDVLPLGAAGDGETDADGGVEVAAGDVADGVDAGHHGEAEGERDAEEADSERVAGVGEGGGEDRGADAAGDQEEGAERLRRVARSGRVLLGVLGALLARGAAGGVGAGHDRSLSRVGGVPAGSPGTGTLQHPAAEPEPGRGGLSDSVARRFRERPGATRSAAIPGAPAQASDTVATGRRPHVPAPGTGGKQAPGGTRTAPSTSLFSSAHHPATVL